MGYFADILRAPELPTTTGVRLWPNDDGSFTLVWQRPLGSIEGFAVLCGAEPAALHEVARLAANVLHWQVPASTTGYLAVACVRRKSVGPPGACVLLNMPKAEATLPRPQLAVESDEPAHAPFGSCVCCTPERILVPSNGTLICPQTAAAHVLLGSGAALLVADLPFGLCVCCDPAQPLIRSGEQVVCYARPEQTYTRQGEQWRPSAPTSSVQADADAIDAALRANSALIGLNGVFYD